jgi:hypothetical protein
VSRHRTCTVRAAGPWPDDHPGGDPVLFPAPGNIRRSYELHANAYIVKPTDFDGCNDVIKAIGACFLGLIQPRHLRDVGTRTGFARSRTYGMTWMP